MLVVLNLLNIFLKLYIVAVCEGSGRAASDHFGTCRMTPDHLGVNQLHTSSGRVPSIEAYKLYVGELMDKSKLSAKDIGVIRNAFKDHADNMEKVAQNVVKVISELTDYTSVAYTSHNDKEKIVKLDIFRYRPTQALLLIVTENKVHQNCLNQTFFTFLFFLLFILSICLFKIIKIFK